LRQARFALEFTRTERRLDGQHLFLDVVKLQPGSSLEDENLRTNTQPKDKSRNDDQTMQLAATTCPLTPRA
jgi:hypothetical protein